MKYLILVVGCLSGCAGVCDGYPKLTGDMCIGVNEVGVEEADLIEIIDIFEDFLNVKIEDTVRFEFSPDEIYVKNQYAYGFCNLYQGEYTVRVRASSAYIRETSLVHELLHVVYFSQGEYGHPDGVFIHACWKRYNDGGLTLEEEHICRQKTIEYRIKEKVRGHYEKK